MALINSDKPIHCLANGMFVISNSVIDYLNRNNIKFKVVDHGI